MTEKVYTIVSEVMNVAIEKINNASSPETIKEWDSLKHMNLVLALEEGFEVQFSDEDIVSITSVELILDALKKYGK